MCRSALELEHDLPETLAKGVSRLRGAPRQYIVFLPAILLICLVGRRSSNRRVHATLCLLWLFATMSYLTLTSIDRAVVPR